MSEEDALESLLNIGKLDLSAAVIPKEPPRTRKSSRRAQQKDPITQDDKLLSEPAKKKGRTDASDPLKDLQM